MVYNKIGTQVKLSIVGNTPSPKKHVALSPVDPIGNYNKASRHFTRNQAG
jgi:hypothetical protein